MPSQTVSAASAGTGNATATITLTSGTMQHYSPLQSSQTGKKGKKGKFKEDLSHNLSKSVQVRLQAAFFQKYYWPNLPYFGEDGVSGRKIYKQIAIFCTFLQVHDVLCNRKINKFSENFQ